MSDENTESPIPNRKYFSDQEGFETYFEDSTLKKGHENMQEVSLPASEKVQEKCLKNFMIGQKIGLGTFSKVCVATHIPTNQKVAIKIIEKSKILNEADKTRLNRQIKIMRKVRHPNIVQLYQIIETKKYIYLVSEFAARGELFQHIISQQKLTQFQAARLLLQLINAIEYLHKLGVAHRDIKPQNLLLDYKFNIKVIDFGLSNIYSQSSQLSTACGSPCYACPEMVSCQPYDGVKADIWSAGIVLYAMCFGYLPFENENTHILYEMIKQGNFEIPETASKQLSDILMKILQTNPSKRASIQDIRSHPFFINNAAKQIRSDGIIVTLSELPYENDIEKQMKQEFGIDTNNLKQSIKNNKHIEQTCTYYLILQRKLRENNQSWANYYAKKTNQINRYSIIERVKATFDRKMMSKKQNRVHRYEQHMTEQRKSSRISMERICKTIEKYDNLKNKSIDRSPQKTRRLKRHDELGKFEGIKKETAKYKPKSDSKKKKMPTPKRPNQPTNKTKSSEKRKIKNKSLPKGVKLIF